MVAIKIFRLPDSDHNVALPARSMPHAAGIDLRANLKNDDRNEGLSIPARSRRLIPTGVAIVLPDGYEGQIRPRSGLALRRGITVLNSPGTVDSDYRGEVCVVLINHSDHEFVVGHGDRIAQLVVSKVERVTLELSEELPRSTRGKRGFGSTGTR